MMADISRFSPLDPESQKNHDETEYESEKLAREIPEVLKRYNVEFKSTMWKEEG